MIYSSLINADIPDCYKNKSDCCKNKYLSIIMLAPKSFNLIGLSPLLIAQSTLKIAQTVPRKDLITKKKKTNFQRIFCLCSDFGPYIFQEKVTLKSTKSLSRIAISLADKAKPKAEIQ